MAKVVKISKQREQTIQTAQKENSKPFTKTYVFRYWDRLLSLRKSSMIRLEFTMSIAAVAPTLAACPSSLNASIPGPRRTNAPVLVPTAGVGPATALNLTAIFFGVDVTTSGMARAMDTDGVAMGEWGREICNGVLGVGVWPANKRSTDHN